MPFSRCGKLIVATSAEQVGALDGIIAKARANGVDDLVLISREQARRRMEPQLQCVAAVLIRPAPASSTAMR